MHIEWFMGRNNIQMANYIRNVSTKFNKKITPEKILYNKSEKFL